MGLCFSIPKGTKVPPSLKNIYLALQNDKNVEFNMPAPIHGDLQSWANQGVFMLNTVLTVVEKKSNSHKKQGWEELAAAALEAINQKLDHVVFLLWGKQAHAAGAKIN